VFDEEVVVEMAAAVVLSETIALVAEQGELPAYVYRLLAWW